MRGLTASVLLAAANAEPEGSLRLNANDDNSRRFKNSQYGRLEIISDGKWGTICDNEFNKPAADVACRSMGFRAVGWQSNYYKISKGNIGSLNIETGRQVHFANFDCNGDENGLMECAFVGADNLPCICDSDHDIVMQCKGKCPINPETELRDCTLPDKPTRKPKNQCDDIPKQCIAQLEGGDPPCNGCQSWRDLCLDEPQIAPFDEKTGESTEMSTISPPPPSPPNFHFVSHNTTTLEPIENTTSPYASSKIPTSPTKETTTVVEATTVDQSSKLPIIDESSSGSSSSGCRMVEGGAEICDEVEDVLTDEATPSRTDFIITDVAAPSSIEGDTTHESTYDLVAVTDESLNTEDTFSGDGSDDEDMQTPASIAIGSNNEYDGVPLGDSQTGGADSEAVDSSGDEGWTDPFKELGFDVHKPIESNDDEIFERDPEDEVEDTYAETDFQSRSEDAGLMSTKEAVKFVENETNEDEEKMVSDQNDEDLVAIPEVDEVVPFETAPDVEQAENIISTEEPENINIAGDAGHDENIETHMNVDTITETEADETTEERDEVMATPEKAKEADEAIEEHDEIMETPKKSEVTDETIEEHDEMIETPEKSEVADETMEDHDAITEAPKDAEEADETMEDHDAITEAPKDAEEADELPEHHARVPHRNDNLPANTQGPTIQKPVGRPGPGTSGAISADKEQNEPEVSIASIGNVKIPAWVWILVAIISVIVILCLVLAITRCVRNSSGRVMYHEPGLKGPKV